MRWPDRVTLWEVGPRDGLQNEAVTLCAEQKIAFIQDLVAAGVKHIEASSFVSPQWIPRLADADEVCAALPRDAGVTYAALVPNLRGLERAIAARIDVAAVFMSASETHNQRNINKSIEQTLPLLTEVAKQARASGMRVRGYISTVFGCPYEGAVDVSTVRRIALTLLAGGVDEIALGDTIGVASPRQTEAVLEVLLRDVPADRLALHMHDTRGAALANILTGLEMGITRFDSSLGGLGGCPYAPGAAGNVATDDLVHLLHGCQVHTGIDEVLLGEAGQHLSRELGKPLNSRMSQVLATEKGACS
ncbi:MAG: hydroxymethylglutaryl-CoA lyase [Firmicutes bacterium]|nr:hydroxymethylglutaryl-CoA lyase [Bacillota bacterium]